MTSGACIRPARHTGMAFITLMIAIPLFFSSCHRNEKQFGAAITSRDSTAIMTTRGISSVISEQGMVKYHIIAEEWAMFDKFKPPYQAFEKGVYLEAYDTLMNVTSTIKADTAYYYDNTELWELRGNVHGTNVDGEEFDTQLLFWDQRKETVYSNDDITVRQEKQVIHGKGFDSNQDFTRYTIRKTDGIFPIDEEE